MFLSSEADNHQTLDGDNDKQLGAMKMRMVSKYEFFLASHYRYKYRWKWRGWWWLRKVSMRCFWQGGDYTSIEEDSEESCIRQLPRGGGVALFCPSQENPANCKAWTRGVRCPAFWVVKAWILQCMKVYLKLFTPYLEEVILNHPVRIHQPFFVRFVWLITSCSRRRKKCFCTILITF